MTVTTGGDGLIGRVVGLYRYPVKSMTGEALEAAELTPRGLLGDRAYALIDRATGRVASAKRPRKWPGILDHSATFLTPPVRGDPIPPVKIEFPDGGSARSTERERLESRLSASLGTVVALESEAPDGAMFEYHWPDMAGLVYEGRTFRDEITRHEMPPGTFFDSSSLLVLTTASLAHLGGLAGRGDLDARRFRPNIIVEPADGAAGFVENDWPGRTLRIGDDVAIEITKPCLRCVMVTLPQIELPKDPGVLRAAFDHNEGNVGVKARPLSAGRLAVGDPVRIE